MSGSTSHPLISERLARLANLTGLPGPFTVSQDPCVAPGRRETGDRTSRRADCQIMRVNRK
jgi:hypothetical protein